MSTYRAQFPENSYLVFPVPTWDDDAEKWKPSYRIITHEEPRIVIHQHEPTEEGFNTSLVVYWGDVAESNYYLYRKEHIFSSDCDGKTTTLEISRVPLQTFTRARDGASLSHYEICPEFLQEPGNPFLKWERVEKEYRDHQAEAAGY